MCTKKKKGNINIDPISQLAKLNRITHTKYYTGISTCQNCNNIRTLVDISKTDLSQRF